jgi:thymidylate kinase
MDRSYAQLHSRGSKSLGPLLVSFSGIDGAGKTTQIEKLNDWLRDAGLRVRLIRFWNDVATLRRLREALALALFKGEQGVGAPDRPVRRKDKNVQSWYMLPVRIVLCSLDSVALALLLARLRKRTDTDVIILDRYLYDQLANLDANSRLLRAYFRLLLGLVPRPDVAFLLDVEPVLAQVRKPQEVSRTACLGRCLTPYQ